MRFYLTRVIILAVLLLWYQAMATGGTRYEYGDLYHVFAGSLATVKKTSVRIVSQRFDLKFFQPRGQIKPAVRVQIEFVLFNPSLYWKRVDISVNTPDELCCDNGEASADWQNLGVSVRSPRGKWFRKPDFQDGQFQLRFAPRVTQRIRVTYRIPDTSGFGNGTDIRIDPFSDYNNWGWASKSLVTTVVIHYPRRVRSEILIKNPRRIYQKSEPKRFNQSLKPMLRQSSFIWHLRNVDGENKKFVFSILDPLYYNQLLQTRGFIRQAHRNTKALIRLARLTRNDFIEELTRDNDDFRQESNNALKKALLLEPNNPDVHYWYIRFQIDDRIEFFAYLSQWDDILQQIEALEKLQPNQARTRYLLNLIESALWGQPIVLPRTRVEQRIWSVTKLISVLTKKTGLEAKADGCLLPNDVKKDDFDKIYAFTSRVARWQNLQDSLEKSWFQLGRAWDYTARPIYTHEGIRTGVIAATSYFESTTKQRYSIFLRAARINQETIQVCFLIIRGYV